MHTTKLDSEDGWPFMPFHMGVRMGSEDGYPNFLDSIQHVSSTIKLSGSSRRALLRPQATSQGHAKSSTCILVPTLPMVFG